MDVAQAYSFMEKNKTGKLIVVSQTGDLRGLYTFKDVAEIIEKATPFYNRDEEGRLRVGANIGVFDPEDKKSREKFLERAAKLLEEKCDVLLIGTAHGDTDNVINSVQLVRQEFKRYNFGIVAGNVATASGTSDLINVGADAIKVGIGAGTICTTGVISGVGAPQLSAFYECAKAADRYGVPICGDGGLRYSGDIPKAIGAGPKLENKAYIREVQD
jgi:IMP dehydrogenase